MVDLSPSQTPRSVSFVAWGVILFACTNIWRIVGLAWESPLPIESGMTLSARTRLVGAFAWAVVFAIQAILLWRRQRVARWMVSLVFLLYGAYQLGLVAFFVVSSAAHNGWQALLLFYVSVSLLTYLLLNRRAAARFWRTTDKTP